MPLGLLAKDSIQDLESLGKDFASHYGESNASGKTAVTASTEEEQEAVVSPEREEESTNKKTLDVLSRSASSDADADVASQASGESSTKANPQQPEDYNNNARRNEQQQQQQQKQQSRQQHQQVLFNTDYYYNSTNFEDYYHPHDSLYVPSQKPKHHTEGGGGLLGCLFPWLIRSHEPMLEEPAETSTSREKRLEKEAPEEKKSDRGSVGEEEQDGGESTNSNALGERLSDRDRQAVLARLRLAEPQAVAADHSSNSEMGVTDPESLASSDVGGGGESATTKKQQPNKQGLLNGIPVYDTSPLLQEEQNRDGAECALNAASTAPPVLKGILKKRSMSNLDNHVMKNGVLLQRRLSHAETGNSSASNSSRSLSAIAAAAPQTSHRRSLFPSYEVRSSKPGTTNSVSFAPMARVVTVKSKNDMTDEEKGDIWWRRSDYEDFRKTGRIITRAMLEGGSEIWLAFNESSWNSKKKDKKKKAADRDVSPEGSESGDTLSSTNDKWWHKFGHSRRGLEHVVSMDEGRQRQMNVKKAIRAVLDEHARQKMYKRVDREKLRSVSLHHTSWARDLALASAASDAHAVETSFSKDRRSREFYLLKIARTSPKTTVAKSVPQFMQPAAHKIPAGGGRINLLQQQRLDANTASQISYRRRSTQPQPSAAETSSTTSAAPPKEEETKESTNKPSNESCEPVHDPNPEDSKRTKSLAEQAAGFSADGEKVNMAAVLSGMGAVLNNEDDKLPATMKVAS